MLPELLQITNLFHLLHRMDTDLADNLEQAGERGLVKRKWVLLRSNLPRDG